MLNRKIVVDDELNRTLYEQFKPVLDGASVDQFETLGMGGPTKRPHLDMPELIQGDALSVVAQSLGRVKRAVVVVYRQLCGRRTELNQSKSATTDHVMLACVWRHQFSGELNDVELFWFFKSCSKHF